MQIEIDKANLGGNKIISYTDDCFKLNNRLIRKNLIISKNYIHEDLLTKNFQDFALQHLKIVMSWDPEIILIGSGKKAILPNADWINHTNAKNIGLELMNTGAACRSYNLLIDEGRNVVACLFLPIFA